MNSVPTPLSIPSAGYLLPPGQLRFQIPDFGVRGKCNLSCVTQSVLYYRTEELQDRWYGVVAYWLLAGCMYWDDGYFGCFSSLQGKYWFVGQQWVVVRMDLDWEREILSTVPGIPASSCVARSWGGIYWDGKMEEA